MTAGDTARWHAAIAWALVGEQLGLPESGAPDPARLVVDLAERGWTAPRIGQHAAGEVIAERAWPHQIPSGLRAGCGAAQLFAALGRTRVLLGLATLDTRPPSRRTSLDADERRLLRDVPPHHGV